MTMWSNRLWMTDRRHTPRYRVDGYDELKGELLYGEYLRKRLCTFGHGGCGFYVDFEPKKAPFFERFLEAYVMKKGRKIELSFELKGILPLTTHVTGTIRYSAKVDDEDPFSPWYFGIEFDPESRYRLLPIAEHLDTLAAKRIIEEE